MSHLRVAGSITSVSCVTLGSCWVHCFSVLCHTWQLLGPSLRCLVSCLTWQLLGPLLQCLVSHLTVAGSITSLSCVTLNVTVAGSIVSVSCVTLYSCWVHHFSVMCHTWQLLGPSFQCLGKCMLFLHRLVLETSRWAACRFDWLGVEMPSDSLITVSSVDGSGSAIRQPDHCQQCWWEWECHQTAWSLSAVLMGVGVPSDSLITVSSVDGSGSAIRQPDHCQ